MPINLPLTIGSSLAIPIVSHFIRGAKIDKTKTTRNIVAGAMASFFVLAVGQLIQEQYAPAARVAAPARRAVPTTNARPIKLSSPVSVGFDTHPISEFYDDKNHVYVD